MALPNDRVTTDDTVHPLFARLVAVPHPQACGAVGKRPVLLQAGPDYWGHCIFE